MSRVTVVLLLVLLAPATASAQHATRLLARGDAAFRAGDTAAARVAYEAVLRADPDQSRAVYQLARLQPAGSAEQLRLFRRYTEMEPADAWGYAALGEAYEEAGEAAAARDAYAAALELAPNAPDIRAAHARLQPQPRRSHTMSLEPVARYIGDSDDTRTAVAGLAGSALVADSVRIGIDVARLDVSDGVVTATGWEGALSGEWRPRRALLLYGRAGLVNVTADGGAAARQPVAQLRARWRPEHGVALDVRARHEPLSANPQLFVAPVVLTEARGTVQLPIVSLLHVRALGRYGRLRDPFDVNTRTTFGGGPVLRLTPVLELGAAATRAGYAKRSTAGYFAPQRADALDVGVYYEQYAWWPLTIALDVGGGVERITAFDGPTGEWQRALRLWSQTSWAFSDRGDVRLEVEAYESQISTVVATTPGAWRWASLALSVALRP